MRTWSSLFLLVTCTVGLSFTAEGSAQTPLPLDSSGADLRAVELERTAAACCLVDGSCFLLEEWECQLSGGFWMGGTGSEPAVTEYAVYRRQDRSLANRPSSPASRRMVGERGEIPHPGFSGSGARIEGWDCVGVVPASGDDSYQLVSPTLCDSTAQGGICWSVFFVSAVTEIPNEFYDSAPDSGYSVDNLAPDVPTGLNWVIEFTLLGWDEAPEEDFACFSVYGSDEPEFDEQNATLIGDTVEPQMAVSGFSYYHVRATDLAGNRGGPVTWDGRDAGGGAQSAGVYFCRLEADGQVLTRKLMLAR